MKTTSQHGGHSPAPTAVRSPPMGWDADMGRSGGDEAGLAPPVGYSPDFLTPARQAGQFGAGLDLVLATPQRRIRDDLTAGEGPSCTRGSKRS